MSVLARLGTRNRASAANTAEKSRAAWKPEIAKRWIMPDLRKSAFSDSGRCSLSPKKAAWKTPRASCVSAIFMTPRLRLLMHVRVAAFVTDLPAC
ncbi:hypothetical protein R80B4_02622 [Fibrobacteres bacterium R8-0-B4]